MTDGPDDDFLSTDARALLRLAKKPVARSAEEQARTAARIDDLALAPAPVTKPWYSAKVIGLAAAGGVCVALVAVLARHPGSARSSGATTPRATTTAIIRPAHGGAVMPVASSSSRPVTNAPTAVDAGASRSAPSASLSAHSSRAHASNERAMVEPPAVLTESAAAEAERASAATETAGGEGIGGGARTASQLTREIEILSRAQAVLADNPHEALARLELHAATFPRGQLAAEREFIAIDALTRLARSADAHRRGDAFLLAYPHDIHAERVRQMLATVPSP